MAKHKAPTQVTIAPTEELSAFSSFVQRAWKPFTAISVVLIGMVVYMGLSSKSAREADHADWDMLSEKLNMNMMTGESSTTAADVDALRAALDGKESAPWALYLAAVAFTNDREWDLAAAQLRELKSGYASHPLNQDTYEFDGADAPETVVDHLLRVIEDQKSWTSANPELFANPTPGESNPKVRVTTGEGSFVVALYPERAPKHVENFLKLCREGFYNDTVFHRVMPTALIHGGDPNTREEDQSQWGSGGPGYGIENEDSGLYHFQGSLGAWKENGEEESSGSQFYITLNDIHGLDDQRVLFGTITEGLETVTAIGEGEITPPDAPVTPVKILSTEVL